MTKLKGVDPNSKTGRRVIGDLRKKLGTDDRKEIINFGKKYGILKDVDIEPVYKKDGGLAMAIEKVKAKEMELGGDVAKPKSRPKSLKADKTESLDKEFSKKVAKTNKKNMANVKKDAVPPKFKGFSKLPEKVQQKIDPNLADKYEMGGKVEEYGAGGNVKGGKMGCRGMGAALRGGGFSIR